MNNVIIVGGGISGLSAALFTAKAGLKTTVFDKGQSQIKKVSKVQNYPGIKDGISGPDLVKEIQEQVKAFGAELLEEEVASVKKDGDTFKVVADGKTYEAKYVILAANVNHALVEALGFELETNPVVPNNKIQSIKGIGYDGVTSIENLYVAGLHANINSQVVVVAGQGAHVGLTVANKEQAEGKPFMWHDI